MPEVLGNPPSPRTALFWNGAAWQWALVDAQGHLQIDALSTVMDAAAATAANQVIINTTVGLVALIRNALQTVASDRLIVRGEDQLFSIGYPLVLAVDTAISGADEYVEVGPVQAGRFWIVTTAVAFDRTTPTTRIEFINQHDGASYAIGAETRAIAAGERVAWGGHTYLDVDDYLRVSFAGGLVADSCRLAITGFWMTAET